MFVLENLLGVPI